MTFHEFKNLIYDQYRPSMYELFNDERVKANRRSYAFSGIELYFEVFKLIQPYIAQNSCIIDIGSYPGTFLRLLQLIFIENRIKLYGQGLVCEDNEIVKYNGHAEANPNINCIRTNMPFIKFMQNEKIEFFQNNLDYCDSSILKSTKPDDLQLKFDIVTCMEVIEHLHTPFLLFDFLNKVTKKDGVCVLETNNVAYLRGMVKLLKGTSNLDFDLIEKYSLNDITIKQPHIRFYSLFEINTLFEKAGFKIIKSYEFNWGYPPSIMQESKSKLSAYIKRMNFIRKLKSHIIVLAQKK
ncbi:MAG: methyltransferase domain-containing protein [Candidatus Marinimicrobia bacterium]|nr:methyltransferase domain-containing protein [Candidatus Neomarinimicrobiota bacterium]